MIRNTVSSKLFQAMALVLLLAPAARGDVAECPNTDLPDAIPIWGEAEIMASRRMDDNNTIADAPLSGIDPLNIIFLPDPDDHHISIVDKDSLQVFDRLTTPSGAFNNPEYSPDGRYAYILSCNGWVQKYDIWSLQQVGQVRAGLNSRNLAVSADGKWLAVANYSPNSLAIISALDLSLGVVHKIISSDGTPSRVSAVRPNPIRESFVLALIDLPKIWEVFYGANPPDIGFSHDWKLEEIVPQSTPFPIRKFTIPNPLTEFILDQSYEYLLGTTQQGDEVVIDLVIGQRVDPPLGMVAE